MKIVFITGEGILRQNRSRDCRGKPQPGIWSRPVERKQWRRKNDTGYGTTILTIAGVIIAPFCKNNFRIQWIIVSISFLRLCR